MKTLLTAEFVIGFDGEDHVIIENGQVVYEDDTIIYVGKNYQGEYDDKIDAGRSVISPGFIDLNALGDIENAIRNAEGGFSPVNDGKSIRITLPPLTEERRNEFVKLIQKMSEEAKVVIRNAREDVWKDIKDMEKKGELTEDDKYAAEKELNDIIKEYNDKIDKMSDIKSEELKKV